MKLKMAAALATGVVVAPHAGAWIETGEYFCDVQPLRSHPTRVRGLKPCRGYGQTAIVQVAPHAGAWIETVNW